MNTQNIPQIKSAQSGMVLLEALIAVVLFSMGILALTGLQANMLKNTTDSKYRADASYIAQQTIGELWADPAKVGDYVPPDISTILPNGNLAVVRNGTQFTVTVTWQQPGESAHNFTTTASIAGG